MRYWTQEEDSRLLDLVRKYSLNLNWHTIASEIGSDRTAESCRKRFARIGSDFDIFDSEEEEDHAPVVQRVIYDDSAKADWRERIDVASKVKEVRDRDDPFIPIADVQIDSDGPIAILWTADWQLGSLGVVYDEWMDHMQQFIDFPNMYMGINGDLTSNTHTHRNLAAVWGQVMSPEEQALMVGDLAKELVDKDKILAITLSEEHDQKDARDTGRAGILDMLRDKGIPLFDNRGILTIRLGDYIYIVYMVHKSRWHSTFNQLHSGYREYQLGVPANIVVVSHKHDPASGDFPWYKELRMLTDHLELPVRLGGEVQVIQTGTYEVNSKYSRQFFSMTSKPKLYISILYPDRFEMVLCKSFDAARRQMYG
jgi:hypothetical protein